MGADEEHAAKIDRKRSQLSAISTLVAASVNRRYWLRREKEVAAELRALLKDEPEHPEGNEP